MTNLNLFYRAFNKNNKTSRSGTSQWVKLKYHITPIFSLGFIELSSIGGESAVDCTASLSTSIPELDGQYAGGRLQQGQGLPLVHANAPQFFQRS